MSNLVDRAHDALLDNDDELVCSLIPSYEIYFDLINGNALSTETLSKIRPHSAFLADTAARGIETSFIHLVLLFKNKAVLKHLDDLGILRKVLSHLLLKPSSEVQAACNEKGFRLILDTIDLSNNQLVSLTKTACGNHYDTMAIMCLDKLPREHGYKQSLGKLLRDAFNRKESALINAILNKHPGIVDNECLLSVIEFIKESDIPFEKVSSILGLASAHVFMDQHRDDALFLNTQRNIKTRVSP